MSNVEPDQPGVIDAALLARLVPVYSTATPEALTAGREAGLVERDEAVERIHDRIKAMFPVEEPSFWTEVSRFISRGSFAGGSTQPQDRQDKTLRAAAELIVDSLPEEARNERVLTQLSVLPYMQQLVANPDAVLQDSRGIQHRASDIAGLVQATALVEQERAAAAGVQIPPGVGIDPVTGNPTLQIPGAEAAQAGLTAQQIRVATRYGSIPFDGQPLRVDLTGVVQPVRAGRVPGPEFAGFAQDPMTGAQRPMSTSTTLMPPGVTGSSGVVSVTQAADYLYSLAPQEVEQLQERLRAAGYFTQMGFDQNTGIQSMIEVPFERGYSDDQATSDAWIAVITDALREQRSVDELLRNRSMDFERRRQNIVESTTQQRTQQFAGSLRNVREMADEFAIETLGRRLTVDEFVGVRDYVRKLQGERAGQIAGRELEPWMAEAPEMGFTQRELGEQVVETLGQSELDRPGGSIWTRLQEKYGF